MVHLIEANRRHEKVRITLRRASKFSSLTKAGNEGWAHFIFANSEDCCQSAKVICTRGNSV